MLKTTHKRLFLLGVVGIGNRVYRQDWASGSLTFTMSHKPCRTIVFNAFSLFSALPTCCCPFCLSTLGKLVDLETFFLFSPNLVGDTALTVTAHAFFDLNLLIRRSSPSISLEYTYFLAPELTKEIVKQALSNFTYLVEPEKVSKPTTVALNSQFASENENKEQNAIKNQEAFQLNQLADLSKSQEELNQEIAADVLQKILRFMTLKQEIRTLLGEKAEQVFSSF
jgi:hypothetical protein